MGVVVALALGLLAGALFSAAHRRAGPVAAAVSVGAFVAAADLEHIVSSSLIDAVTAALVILSVALVGRGTVGSLVLSGLLRPEGWVASGVAGYMESAGSQARRFALAAGAGLLPLALWTAFDLVLTGDPLATREFREDSAPSWAGERRGASGRRFACSRSDSPLKASSSSPWAPSGSSCTPSAPARRGGRAHCLFFWPSCGRPCSWSRRSAAISMCSPVTSSLSSCSSRSDPVSWPGRSCVFLRAHDGRSRPQPSRWHSPASALRVWNSVRVGSAGHLSGAPSFDPSLQSSGCSSAADSASWAGAASAG
jgi:hypothetical protein